MKPRFFSVLLSAFSLSPISPCLGDSAGENIRFSNWITQNESLIIAQIRFIGLPVDIGFDQQVRRFIDRYLISGRVEMEAILGRAEFYLPIFEEKLAEHGLPPTLKYLPIIESGLRTRIASTAGAAGLWQLMPATARRFKLKINEWVDERLDPYKSTEAAVSYLAELYEEFEDWALAAYNCGPGRVRRAMRMAGSQDYRDIRPHLPRQTQCYIANYKAAAYVSYYRQIFGLRPRKARHLSRDVQQVRVHEAYTLREIADIVELPLDKVRALNPTYVQGVIPASNKGNLINLPAGAAATLRAHAHQHFNEDLAALHALSHKRLEVPQNPVGNGRLVWLIQGMIVEAGALSLVDAAHTHPEGPALRRLSDRLHPQPKRKPMPAPNCSREVILHWRQRSESVENALPIA
jgi:hypothetical protein